MDVNGLKNYQASMAQSLSQATSQIFNDVRASGDKVDQKKQQIADSGLKQVQAANERAAQRAGAIDIYV